MRSPDAGLHSLTDEDLMHLVCESDAAAFAILYRRHADVAYSVAARMVRSPARAEDVVQEAFLAVWRSARGYDPGVAAPRAWVMGIVRHRAADALRRAARDARGRDDDEDAVEQVASRDRTDDQASRREEAVRVRDALASLPVDQGAALRLAYFGDMSQTEIADRLEIPLGTVKSRMRLGLARLRTMLEPVLQPRG